VSPIQRGAHGKAIADNEIRILNPKSGAKLPVGQSGQIVLRSIGNFKGSGASPRPSPRASGFFEEIGFLSPASRMPQMNAGIAEELMKEA